MSTGSGVRLVVMGVAGSGKSTVGAALAAHLGARYVEADDLHDPASIARMSAGIPLTDQDRWPWLLRLQRTLAEPGPVVVSCSALKRSYRDLLRRAGGVRFVFLDVDRDEVERRVAARPGHFMGPSMVAGQFAALERPDPATEPDVVTVTGPATVAAVLAGLEAAAAGDAALVAPALLAVGSPATSIGLDALDALVGTVVEEQVLSRGARRVLLVPPDHTRLFSRAGEITAMAYRRLVAAGVETAVLPALGTHAEMTPDDVALLFGPDVPMASIRHHRWRDGLVRLGELDAAELSELTGGRFTEPVPVEVDGCLLDDWDLVISVGQVVPHEVIGMANFTKNLVIGLGGAPTVHRSHFVGAISDMEALMGRPGGPVRHIVDAAFDRFIAPRVPVLWLLTVMEDTADGVVQRGLFVGRGGSGDTGGAAYRAAAALAAACNVTVIDEDLPRVVCRLDPHEFRSTWLGNKAVYRTRMALADGGELVVLAPGVHVFGEDPGIDALIRRHGYRGTTATLAALAGDPELAAGLGAAAHLIHGSSEGRFRITYCTDPASGGLTRDEVEGVGYGWRPLADELAHLGLDDTSAAGDRVDVDGRPFRYIANPALGLWATRHRFGR